MSEAVCGVNIPLPGDNGLADAMARLPAHAREILLLRYYNGYSTTELADFFGVLFAAVKKQLSRAKSALKKRMEEGDMTHAE